MFVRFTTLIAGIALAFLMFFGSLALAADAQAAPLELGVFFPDPDRPGEEVPTVTDLHDFEAAIGRQTDVFLWYESISESFYADNFRPMAQEGRAIQLAWEPHSFGRDPLNQPEYRLERITAGDWDNDIRRWARELRDFGYPIYFRPMSEMNGDWVTWGGTVNGNTPDDYIPAWRHVHDIFRQEGATNVKFVWSPNRDGDAASAQNTFNTYYPGDAYVDYVGINGYNWGRLYTTPEWTSQWQLFEEVFGPSYDVFTARTSKPVVISETASTEVGGDKAAWITNAFSRLPERFPRIEMLTWFHINKETDWRINSSSASLAAFRDAVRGPDATPPSVAVTSPVAGAVLSGDSSINVNAADDRGVARVELYEGGNLLGSVTTAPYSISLATRAMANGAHTLTVKAIDQAGNQAAADVNVNIDNNSERNYYFGWYDNASPGMRTWIIIGNPTGAPQQAAVYIGGRLMGTYDVGSQQRATPIYNGVSDGSVKVVSVTGGELVVSERVTYNGTFSETPAVPQERLSSEQYLSWYDGQGMRSWVLVTNQGSQTANVDVYIGNQLMGHYDVPAGGKVAPEYPGVLNGPVRVVATNGQPLTVSQRVVFNNAFNEIPGKPVSELTSEYFFTWYDGQGMRSWVVVGNQGGQSAEVDIYIGERLMGRYSIPAGGRVAPEYPGVMDGPVRVVSTNGQPLVAGERSTYRGSFEEVAGTANSNLSSEQWFTWYDYASPGMKTWILVGNQGGQSAEVDIRINGSVVGHYTIPAGGRVGPTFPGQLSGPVQVTSTNGQPLVVSQRVTYNNSFDELAGSVVR